MALTVGRVDAIIADAPVLEYYEHTRAESDVSVVGQIFEHINTASPCRWTAPCENR